MHFKTIAIICVAAVSLSACGFKPLRSSEQATAEAIVEASAEAAVVEEAINKSAGQTTVNSTELTVLIDSITGCEYVTNGNGLSPRMAFYSQNTRTGPIYRHLGCTQVK